MCECQKHGTSSNAETAITRKAELRKKRNAEAKANSEEVVDAESALMRRQMPRRHCTQTRPEHSASGWLEIKLEPETRKREPGASSLPDGVVLAQLLQPIAQPPLQRRRSVGIES